MAAAHTRGPLTGPWPRPAVKATLFYCFSSKGCGVLCSVLCAGASLAGGGQLSIELSGEGVPAPGHPRECRWGRPLGANETVGAGEAVLLAPQQNCRSLSPGPAACGLLPPIHCLQGWNPSLKCKSGPVVPCLKFFSRSPERAGEAGSQDRWPGRPCRPAPRPLCPCLWGDP